MIFILLGIPFSSMKFVSIVQRFCDGFWSHVWCFFDTFLVRTCNLLNHQKHLFFQWISMILHLREKLFLMIFLIFFVTSFGIDFWWVLVSILAPFWDPCGINFYVFWWAFFGWIVESMFDRFVIKMGSTNWFVYGDGTLFFRSLFPHTCTFYQRKTYKCQKPCFATFEID